MKIISETIDGRVTFMGKLVCDLDEDERVMFNDFIIEVKKELAKEKDDLDDN